MIPGVGWHITGAPEVAMVLRRRGMDDCREIGMRLIG